MSACVMTGDPANVVSVTKKRPLTDQEKMYVLENSFNPHPRYKFPGRSISGSIRHFQRSWLDKYNGLVYSECTNGGYCKYCILFGTCSPVDSRPGVLVSKPLVNLKKASEKLEKHFKSQFHKFAVESAIHFRANTTPIDQQLNTIRQQRIAENRSKLRSIVETVIFCGRQGIALRGHRDDRTTVNEDPDHNHGNFWALLNFRVSSGDNVLEQHLKNTTGNASYTSKTVQNQLISLCGDFIRETILKQAREASALSVIADEATDVANLEQLSISIRYVHNNVLYERFLGFIACETGVTGEALAENILTQLTSWQLSPDLLYGQSYDGAGAMSGKVKGVAARINSQYPKALFVHCASHRLNLCIMRSCSGREVSNMIDTVSCIARFFNYSPKRQLCLDKWIMDTLPTEEKRRKLKELCKTRWVERYDSYEVFIDLFVPIACCLEDIANSSNAQWNRETRSEALSFLLALSQFSLIFTLIMVHTILSCTRGLSIKLQAQYMDTIRAHSDIDLVKSTLKGYRSRVDEFHHRVYGKALTLAVSIDVQESSPRLAGRQTQRHNVQAANAKDYYRLNLMIPFLDHMITELDTRFDSQSSKNSHNYFQQ